MTFHPTLLLPPSCGGCLLNCSVKPEYINSTVMGLQEKVARTQCSTCFLHTDVPCHQKDKRSKYVRRNKSDKSITVHSKRSDQDKKPSCCERADCLVAPLTEPGVRTKALDMGQTEGTHKGRTHWEQKDSSCWSVRFI